MTSAVVDLCLTDEDEKPTKQRKVQKITGAVIDLLEGDATALQGRSLPKNLFPQVVSLLDNNEKSKSPAAAAAAPQVVNLLDDDDEDDDENDLDRKPAAKPRKRSRNKATIPQRPSSPIFILPKIESSSVASLPTPINPLAAKNTVAFGNKFKTHSPPAPKATSHDTQTTSRYLRTKDHPPSPWPLHARPPPSAATTSIKNHPPTPSYVSTSGSAAVPQFSIKANSQFTESPPTRFHPTKDHPPSPWPIHARPPPPTTTATTNTIAAPTTATPTLVPFSDRPPPPNATAKQPPKPSDTKYHLPSSTAAVAAAAAAPPPPLLPFKVVTPLERVQEIFPDVENAHAEKLLRDLNNNVDLVLWNLTEYSYPKRKVPTSSANQVADSSSSAPAAGFVIKRPKQQSDSSFLSTTLKPSHMYMIEAIPKLLHDFTFLTMTGGRVMMITHKRYATVHKFLIDCLKGTVPKHATDEQLIAQYDNFKSVWASKHLGSTHRTAIGDSNCLKRSKSRPAPTLTDSFLKEEVQHCRRQLNEWMESMEKRKRLIAERKRVEQMGTGVECGCCFDKVPIDEMVACRDEGHLFCLDCIRSYANTAVFSTGSLGVVKATGKQSCELLCCDASGCQSGFHNDLLQKALPLKTLEKYNELQFRATIEAAGLQGEICSCPKCGYQADLPENLVVFQCPVEDCRYESCRHCGQAAHVPLRCEEVAKQNREDEGRLKVEEAMANAKIRTCPQCKASFVKSDGCNKMTCRCGAYVCYICRQKIRDYSHFCQAPHCNHKKCGKCVLHSNAEEDDLRAMKEAGLTAADTFRKTLQEKQGEDVQIDVDKIMTMGVAKLPRVAQVRARRVNPW